MASFTSKSLTLIGLLTLLFGFSLVWQRYSPKKLTFQNYQSDTTYLVSKKAPAEIIIPRLNINLPIYPAEIKNNAWEATNKGVSYLISSPMPGDTGNSVIYGHNWESLLGRLPNIKPKDKIEVLMNNGDKKTFIVMATALVDPDQTSILKSSMDKRITIYTCAGFLDSKRFVATAVLE
ncbi:MAG TPA: sortase [Patescibacteria group bacterium]|nr:sortase [Patescibacteria group bacterium]